jgi:hypothetical protein
LFLIFFIISRNFRSAFTRGIYMAHSTLYTPSSNNSATPRHARPAASGLKTEY